MLRILILTPTTWPDITGNAITAERWRRALTGQGVFVSVLATHGLDVRTFLEHIETIRPDVVHAHHISRAGALFLQATVVRRCAEIPLVVSPAGTDLSAGQVGLSGEETIVARVCNRASAIVTQVEWTANRLGDLFPRLRERILHVPKAIAWFGNDRFDVREALGWSPDHVVFLYSAGIRPVKRNLETMVAMKEVYKLRPQTRLAFAGPGLDLEYALRFQRELEQCRPFAGWIPLIPHGAMRAAYQSVDVVVNASFSEGLSNAVLEAIHAGLPILASDIPGNRWPLAGEGNTPSCGLFFNVNDPSDFADQALKLIDNDGLRRGLAEAAKKRADAWPTPEEEARALIRAYELARKRYGQDRNDQGERLPNRKSLS